MKLVAAFVVLLAVTHLQTASPTSICSGDSHLHFRMWNRVAKGTFRGTVVVRLAGNNPIIFPAPNKIGNTTVDLSHVEESTKLTVTGYAKTKLIECTLELGPRLGKILACRKDGHRSAIFRYFCM